MKSEKAKQYLDRKSPAKIHPASNSKTYYLLSRYDAEKAIELAEQEAEERMRTRATEAFKSSCKYQDGCMGANKKCDPQQCEDLRLFIQKLDEDASDSVAAHDCQRSDKCNVTFTPAFEHGAERMRNKAHAVILEMMTGIFHGDMPRKIADEFIQKLNEDEVD